MKMYEQICEICGKTFYTRRKRDHHVCWECKEKARLGEKIYNKIKSAKHVEIKECEKLELTLNDPYNSIKCLLYKLINEISEDGTISKEANEKLQIAIRLLYNFIEIAKHEGILHGLKSIFHMNNGEISFMDYNRYIEATKYDLKNEYESLNELLNKYKEDGK